MPIPIHEHLRGLRPVPHGGAAQLGGAPLDFSATVLPGETPRSVLHALDSAPVSPYPDPRCAALRQALAAAHGLSPEQVLPSNGSVALIRAVAAACLGPGDAAAVVGPTFGEYDQAIRIAGARPVQVDAGEAGPVVQAIAASRAKLVFVCSPNNPTGLRWSEDALAEIERAAFLVLDEAYAGFLRPPPPPRPGPGRLILRSLTKDRALAGVRLGYGIAPPETLAPLAELLTPWGVNALAQRAGIAVIRERESFEARIDALWAARGRLISALRTRGWRVEAGEAPFFLMEVGDAAATTRALLEQGIFVRDATSFGLPRHVRISPRTDAEHERLLAALDVLRR